MRGIAKRRIGTRIWQIGLPNQDILGNRRYAGFFPGVEANQHGKSWYTLYTVLRPGSRDQSKVLKVSRHCGDIETPANDETTYSHHPERLHDEFSSQLVRNSTDLESDISEEATLSTTTTTMSTTKTTVNSTAISIPILKGLGNYFEWRNAMIDWFNLVSCYDVALGYLS